MQPTSFRLSEMTSRQLERLVQFTGHTRGEIVALAIDRMYQQELRTMKTRAQQLGYHDIDENGPYRLVTDIFGDVETVTRSELQELIDGWANESEDAEPGFLVTTGGELRYYRTDSPGDFETVGYVLE